MNKKTAVIVFSSDRFFSSIYEKLNQEDISVEALITESPKPQGRGLKVSKNPAHEFGEQKKLEIFFPEKLNGKFSAKISDVIMKLKTNSAVVGLVFAYGKIIPQEIINLFDDKIINIHPSLLPKHRGSSPIQQAILDGDSETGYSIIKISKKIDAGDIIDQRSTKISKTDNFETLRTKILDEALKNLPLIIEKFLSGNVKLTKQDEQSATYSKKIDKSNAKIDASDDCSAAFKKIAAFSLWPKAYFLISGKRFIIHDAFVKHDKLFIQKIQPESKKVLNAKEFVNGYGNLLTYFPEYVKFTQ